jgi:hypothetical protein
MALFYFGMAKVDEGKITKSKSSTAEYSDLGRSASRYKVTGRQRALQAGPAIEEASGYIRDKQGRSQWLSLSY